MDVTDEGTVSDLAWSAVRAAQDGVTDAVWMTGVLPDTTAVAVTPGLDPWFADPMTGLAGIRALPAVWQFLDVVTHVSAWLLPFFPH